MTHLRTTDQTLAHEGETENISSDNQVTQSSQMKLLSIFQYLGFFIEFV